MGLGYHNCALDDTGVVCWGDNKYGQVSVPPLKKVKQVVAAGNCTLAVDEIGLKSWGSCVRMPIQTP